MTPGERPLISIRNGKLHHNETPVRVVLTRDLIRVGCSDVTPQAAKLLIAEWGKNFGEKGDVIVMQEGGA